MTTIAVRGYTVRGVNNVMIKLYPQVLGIHKVHEHNLCNALRDFGLMLKSECRGELLKYNYDFLAFAHTMRSSELCMIAHGYSMLELNDKEWWDKFSDVASNSSYDMDGKEMAGLLYSLSNVYTGQTPLISKLIEESTPWINHASPATLSLLVKVIANLKLRGNYLYRINRRALEIIDQLNMVDVIFFITSNTDAKVQDIELYRTLCIRAIELYDDMELHHLRALAASLSIGGYKSHLFFNVLAMRLIDISKLKKLRDGDVISLFLAFTSQKFLTQNDLCIDMQIYKNFIKDRTGSVNKDKFLFPIPEVSPVLVDALTSNLNKITANGMPIVLRAISILKLQLNDDTHRNIVKRTAQYIRENKYDGLKLSNLIVTISKRLDTHEEFWEAVHEAFQAPGVSMNPDLVAKMTVTLTNTNENSSKRMVYRDLVKMSVNGCKKMSAKSLFALTRTLVANQEIDALCSKEYIDACINLISNLTLSDSYHLLKLYPFKLVPADDENVSRLVKAAQNKLQGSTSDTPCYGLMNALIGDRQE